MFRRFLIGCALGLTVVAVLSWRKETKNLNYEVVSKEIPTQQTKAPVVGVVKDVGKPKKEEGDVLSEPSTESEMHESLQRSPYEAIVEHLMKANPESVIAQQLMMYRSQVLDASDEPEWSRPMERSLYSFIMGLENIGSLEVSSIACSGTGCELQMTTDTNDPTDISHISFLLEREFASMERTNELSGPMGGGKQGKIIHFMRRYPG